MLREWVQSFDVPNVVRELVYARILFAFSDIDQVLCFNICNRSRIEQDSLEQYWFEADVEVVYLEDNCEKYTMCHFDECVLDRYFRYELPYNNKHTIILYVPPIYLHKLDTFYKIVTKKLSLPKNFERITTHYEDEFVWSVSWY